MLCLKTKALTVPMKTLFAFIKRLFRNGYLKNPLIFPKILLKSDFLRKWNDLRRTMIEPFMKMLGLNSLTSTNVYPESTCLLVSGTKPDIYFIVGYRVTGYGVQLTFRKDRQSSQRTDSIVLNFVYQEDHGHVRLKTLMSFRDWCTITKLLNELSADGTQDGS